MVAFGRYEELSDVPEWESERESARALLEKREWWQSPAAITSTHCGGSYEVWYRIPIERLTGFSATPDPAKGFSMKTIGTYALQVTTRRSFEDSIRRVTELLAERGFGILTEIDVQATLKKKLGLDFKPYKILGACNPTYAHRALEAEPNIGVLLPCNIVVWDEEDHRVVAAMEPKIMGDIVDASAVREIAEEVSRSIREVLERVD